MERFSVLATAGCRDSNQRLECVHGGGGCGQAKLEVTQRVRNEKNFKKQQIQGDMAVINTLAPKEYINQRLLEPPPQPPEELALQSLEHHSCWFLRRL
jgi:hypothetical protein